MGGEEAAMRNYVIQRILATVPVMGVVVLFVFLLLRVAVWSKNWNAPIHRRLHTPHTAKESGYQRTSTR
jgi:ABC-type dipeptide/oligopeptide/nickel transport system permease component